MPRAATRLPKLDDNDIKCSGMLGGRPLLACSHPVPKLNLNPTTCFSFYRYTAEAHEATATFLRPTSLLYEIQLPTLVILAL
jgi:hypothetical protein